MRLRNTAWSALMVALASPPDARADGPYALVTGRWEPSVIVVDIAAALAPGNAGTANAIVARLRVSPDAEGAPRASGLPSNIVVAADGESAWVVNHAGNATAAQTAESAHGHAGTLTALNLRAALEPANDGTTNAIEAVVADVGFGPVGLAIASPGRFAVAGSSEGAGREDGGRALSFIDLVLGERVTTLPLGAGDGGQIAQTPARSCDRLVEEAALVPRTLPDGNVGCFPNVNGIVISEQRGVHAFTANGGTDDVSVVDVERALAGDPGAEIARIPVERGPWGIAVSPDGDLVAVTNRDSSESGLEGNTISILDVDRAINGVPGAEVARLLVGTDEPSEATRPFAITFTPDGQAIVVANFRTNNVSVIDVTRALEGRSDAEIARIALTTPVNEPPRPRGVAVTPDGQFAVVSGGARDTARGGWLWVVDLEARDVAAIVTNVGNEPYGLAIVAAPE